MPGGVADGILDAARDRDAPGGSWHGRCPRAGMPVLEAAEKARADSAAASREKDELLRDAQAEAHQIREDARAQAQQIIAQARSEALAEAQRVQDAAQRQILAERQAAQISLRSDVGLLASELAERLVGEHLENTDLTARVVDRFLDELEAEEIPVGGVN